MKIGDRKVKVFGVEKWNDVALVIKNGRTMIPARFIAENLGGDVAWDNNLRKVTITGRGVKIELCIGSSKAYVNGKVKMTDSPAYIEGGRMYTPARFIAECLGTEGVWKIATREVGIFAN